MSNQEILDGVILHSLEYKNSDWGNVFYHWDDMTIWNEIEGCKTLENALDRIAVSCGFIRKYNEEKIERAIMSYFVAGTNEQVNSSEEYLKKEEAYCRSHPEFLEEFWSENCDGNYEFETALQTYMSGLQEDVKNDAQYEALD